MEDYKKTNMQPEKLIEVDPSAMNPGDNRQECL